MPSLIETDLALIRKPLSLMASLLNDEACLDALEALGRIEITVALLAEMVPQRQVVQVETRRGLGTVVETRQRPPLVIDE